MRREQGVGVCVGVEKVKKRRVMRGDENEGGFLGDAPVRMSLVL